ncbi:MULTISPECIES: cytochrome P450 [unclassified Microcoleus]|uniref:cytochrome P450 n=1 Tax=unclassified Microcoleus TaxID=2642155 RepID=UPI002FCE6F0B
MEPIPQTTVSPVNNSKNSSTQPVRYNPFDPNFQADPYPTYHRLHSEDPVHRTKIIADWVLTRYSDVKSILRDRRIQSFNKPETFAKKNQYLKKQGKNIDALVSTSERLLFYQNPQDHSRLRGLTNKAFSISSIELMRPTIQEIVDELLAQVLDRGHMDIISDFASILPATMISRMLGVPREDEAQLYQWSTILSRLLDPMVPLEEYEEMNQATKGFDEYFLQLIKQREKAPKADLISALIAAREQGDKLSLEELQATGILLFLTASETTVNAIGNGMLALLRNPQQLRLLKENPELISTASEEILRYDSPLQMAVRIAGEDIEVGGKTIRQGDKIILCLGAANRDPEQFVDPDRFDITRTNNNHLAFSDGVRYCLGAALARVEIQVAIQTLVQKLHHIQLAAEQIEWRKILVLRSLKALPVTFVP